MTVKIRSYHFCPPLVVDKKNIPPKTSSVAFALGAFADRFASLSNYELHIKDGTVRKINIKCSAWQTALKIIKVVAFVLLSIFMPVILIAKWKYKDFCSNQIQLRKEYEPPKLRIEPIIPQPITIPETPQPVTVQEEEKKSTENVNKHEEDKGRPLENDIKQDLQTILQPSIKNEEKTNNIQPIDKPSETEIKPETLYIENLDAKCKWFRIYTGYSDANIGLSFFAASQPSTEENLKKIIEQNGQLNLSIDECYHEIFKDIKHPTFEPYAIKCSTIKDSISSILQNLSDEIVDGYLLSCRGVIFCLRKFNDKIEVFNTRGYHIDEVNGVTVPVPYILKFDGSQERDQISNYIALHIEQILFDYGKGAMNEGEQTFSIYPLKYNRKNEV